MFAAFPDSQNSNDGIGGLRGIGAVPMKTDDANDTAGSEVSVRKHKKHTHGSRKSGRDGKNKPTSQDSDSIFLLIL